jgi:hypothetical protein
MHATGATPSFQPLWRQIRALIVHDIEAGAW